MSRENEHERDKKNMTYWYRTRYRTSKYQRMKTKTFKARDRVRVLVTWGETLTVCIHNGALAFLAALTVPVTSLLCARTLHMRVAVKRENEAVRPRSRKVLCSTTHGRKNENSTHAGFPRSVKEATQTKPVIKKQNRT